MDGAGRPSAVKRFFSQASELTPGALYDMPRNPEKRGESKFRRPAGVVIAQRTLGQVVELPTLYIRLELAVPDFRIKLRKPFAECGEFFGRELFYLAFNVLQLTHNKPRCPKYISTSKSRWSAYCRSRVSQSLEGCICPCDVLLVKELGA